MALLYALRDEIDPIFRVKCQGLSELNSGQRSPKPGTFMMQSGKILSSQLRLFPLYSLKKSKRLKGHSASCVPDDLPSDDDFNVAGSFPYSGDLFNLLEGFWRIHGIFGLPVLKTFSISKGFCCFKNARISIVYLVSDTLALIHFGLCWPNLNLRV